MAFALGAGFGLSTLLAGSRRSPRARAALAVAVMAGTALALAWLASQVSPAWSNRYFSVFIGPLLLLGAAGLARGGRLGLVVVAILVAFWFNPRTGALDTKSNAHTTAVLVRDRLERGDMVVAIHPEQGPVLHYYLPQDIGLRWADAMGPVKDPKIFDWRDALDRFKAAKPTPTEDALVRTLQPGPEAAGRLPDHPHRALGRAVDERGAQALRAVAARAGPRQAPVAHAGRARARGKAAAQGRARGPLRAPSSAVKER